MHEKSRRSAGEEKFDKNLSAMTVNKDSKDPSISRNEEQKTR
jgi:hypothetical protein